MTEEQKKLFIEWLDKLIEVNKEAYRLSRICIEGVSNWITCCDFLSLDHIHLGKEAFEIAVDVLTPIIIETPFESENRRKYVQRSFEYKNVKFIGIFEEV